MGLSVAGTSNTLKVVSYNAILGVIAVFSAGAIRQFCTFAVVVLVAHWFLAHTFFLTVLSIDIQRLEVSVVYFHDMGCILTWSSWTNFCGRTQVWDRRYRRGSGRWDIQTRLRIRSCSFAGDCSRAVRPRTLACLW